MQIEEYKRQVERVLTAPLSADTPEQLYKEATVIESLSYLAITLQSRAALRQAEAEAKLREAGEKFPTYHGTAADRKMLFEAEHAELYKEIDKSKAEVYYWKSIGEAIKSKVLLAQSILSNITASIKSGMYLDNVR